MTSLTVAVLSLLLHPHVQARAQAEIDAVVGRDRLPDFGDRASPGDHAQDHCPSHSIDQESEPNNYGKNDSLKLVYVEAIYREILRWIVVLPLGIPHAVTKDDIYNGMIIKKGMSYFNTPEAVMFSIIRLKCIILIIRDNRRRKFMVWSRDRNFIFGRMYLIIFSYQGNSP